MDGSRSMLLSWWLDGGQMSAPFMLSPGGEETHTHACRREPNGKGVSWGKQGGGEMVSGWLQVTGEESTMAGLTRD